MPGYYDLSRATYDLSDYQPGETLAKEAIRNDLLLAMNELYTKYEPTEAGSNDIPGAGNVLVAEKMGGDISSFQPVGNSLTVTQRGCAYTTAGTVAVNVSNTDAREQRKRILFRTAATIGAQAGMHYPAAQTNPNTYSEFHALVSDRAGTNTASQRVWIGFTNAAAQVPNTGISGTLGNHAAFVLDAGDANIGYKWNNDPVVTNATVASTASPNALFTGFYCAVILDSYNKRVRFRWLDMANQNNFGSYDAYSYYPNALMLPRISIVTSTANVAEIAVSFAHLIHPAKDAPCGSPLFWNKITSQNKPDG